MRSDGDVSEGQAVRAGGGADHVGGAPAQPQQNEGDQEDLQVCHERRVVLGSSLAQFDLYWVCSE